MTLDAPHGPVGTARPEGPKEGRARNAAWRWAAGAFAVWALLALVMLVSAARSAQSGMVVLDDIEARATPSNVLSGELSADLRRAQARFSEARRRIRSPVVSPFKLLPVVGRQLRSVDSLSGAAGELAGVGADALDDAVRRIELGAEPGPERARLIADLGEIAGRVEERLGSVDLGPDEALVGPLSERRRAAATKLVELRESTGRASVAAAGFSRLLESDGRYLLLVANNAEMRAGSGMFLTAGPLSFADGRVEVGQLEPTADLLLSDPVPITGDLAERWGWLQPGKEWRNLGISPQFDVTAPLAVRMWERVRGEELDGVLAVDVIALKALLAATGPIDVEGKQLDAGNVEMDLLHDQYVGEDVADVVQSERSPRLAAVAAGALSALHRPDFDVASLIGELAQAAQGRHLLAWSSDAAMQEAWEAAGIDGRLEQDDLLVAVLNRGGNKLDPYLQVDAAVDVEELPGETRVAITLRLSNSVGVDEPLYILGPDPSVDAAPGTYVGLVAASIPGTAAEGRFDGVQRLPVAGRDGPSRVVAAPLIVPRGETRLVTLRFELPPEVRAFDVLPDARVPAIQWQAQGREWAGDHPEAIMW